MRWAVCVECVGRTGVFWVFVGEPEGKDHFEYPGVDGRIILRWTFR